jgi:tetratricopeptide (TPR) repeat protein
MASVDPYASCPCGSGQKYKFCCQKVEAYAERAQRLIDGEQYEAALKPLDEGLAKVPGNPWLLTRKALCNLHLNRMDAAKQALRTLLQGHPNHLNAWVLITQLVLETEGPLAGVAQLHQALSACEPEQRGQFAPLAAFVGTTLARTGAPAAGLKHLELAIRLGAGNDKQTLGALQSLRANPAVSVWEKNPYRLSPPPANVSNEFSASFQQALEWANEGLWSAAASAFELLSPASSAGVVADRNRGLCCLWIGDHEGAVASLRRYIARSGPAIEAIDLEALCQRIDHPPITDSVEFVQLTWPIRNREGLLAALRADRSFDEGPGRAVDPKDQEGPKVERFLLLDRPQIAPKPGLTRQEIPRIEGEVLVSKDVVVLETYDDGRLDRLIDRFVARAGLNIPPAHPRTKVISREPRYLLNLSCRWRIPGGVSEDDADRFNQEQVASMIEEVWPKTPNPHLRGRTPLHAAKAGDAETALRAAVRTLEYTDEEWVERVDWSRFRSSLHLKPEPVIEADLATIEPTIAQLHLSRLSSIPVEQFADERALLIYHWARLWGLRSVMIRAARVIAEHPSLLIKGRLETTALYGDLALDAARRHKRTEAEDWIRRGRQSEPPLKRAAHVLSWEMIDLQVKVMLDDPEVWVPRLAVILDKYRGNQEATSAVYVRLIDLGLVQPVADPNRPEQMALDTRTLQYYLSRYGPRVTTSAGQLGVAAAGGEIWTPESESPGGRSALWTPGSASSAPPGGEKPKLILPGS